MTATFMRTHRKRWLALAVAIAVLLAIIVNYSSNAPAVSSTVTLSFVGYTNLANNNLRFALLSVSNRAAYSIRWHGDWVEIEGSPYYKARTANPNLPGYRRTSVLKGGDSFAMAVGEPLHSSETGRWSLALRVG